MENETRIRFSENLLVVTWLPNHRIFGRKMRLLWRIVGGKTIIWKVVTCKTIRCFVRGSDEGSLLLKILRHFEAMLNIFEFSPVKKTVESWFIWISFHESSDHVSWLTLFFCLSTETISKVSATIFFLIFKSLMGEKKISLKNIYSYNRYNLSAL